ncbi:hypothetical protein [Nostoc sp. UHCC 0251]|uniref:hypothetical protein n=1 Tax=Nostoc sp. UHCC 0251 TaxID=3110240 RepID=UPI002B21E520|nr:hypothetical protein [Nostoc sp. UHCC 0251]MEA5625780.1 hypothetical protein [Nostoc sp. UHCC 0251]
MILKKILPKWFFSDFFLDWKLENWQEIYKNQTGLLNIYYQGCYRSLPQVIVFDNTKENLDLSKINFQLTSHKFKIDESLEAEKIFKLYKKFIYLHKRKLFNETCLRLVSIKVQQKSTNSKCILFQLQTSDYFDYVQTNLCLDAKLNKNHISLREKVHIRDNNYQLEELEDSPLANILGINILIFTSDGTLILQKRSAHTLVRPNQICSSASGTLTKADIPTYQQEFSADKLLPAFLREMFEEIGLEPSSITESQVKFLGVLRELNRGGQPELFLSAYIDYDKNQVLDAYRKAIDKFESKSLLFFKMGSLANEPLDSLERKSKFLSKVDELIEQYQETIAVPLMAHLALWCKSRLQDI